MQLGELTFQLVNEVDALVKARQIVDLPEAADDRLDLLILGRRVAIPALPLAARSRDRADGNAFQLPTSLNNKARNVLVSRV